MMLNSSVAFFGAQDDPFSKAAEDHLREIFREVDAYYGTNAVPPSAPDPGVLDVDWLFSFKTKTIFRAGTLNSVRLGALNFHTSSPAYPGSAGVNWVLYNDDPTSAITVHELTPSVDAGKILQVDTFDRSGIDTVAELLKRTYEQHLETFCSVTSAIARDEEAWIECARDAGTDHCWGSKTYRLKDLESLKRITPDMSAEEVKRRVRATSFGRYGPYIKLHGYNFQLVREAPDGD